MVERQAHALVLTTRRDGGSEGEGTGRREGRCEGERDGGVWERAEGRGVGLEVGWGSGGNGSVWATGVLRGAQDARVRASALPRFRACALPREVPCPSSHLVSAP